MRFEYKIKETRFYGTLLNSLVNFINKYFSKQAIIDVAIDLGGLDGSNLKLIETLCGLKIKNKIVIDINPKPIYKDIAYFQLDLDTCKLPFNKDSVDLILAIEIIEHLKNPDNLLDEIKRVLSPNGIAIITTPNLSWFPYIFLLSLGFQPFFTEISTKKVYERPGKVIQGHLRIFTYKSLKEMLRDYRFKIIEYKTVNTSIVPKLLQPVQLLINKMLPWLGPNIFVVVKK